MTRARHGDDRRTRILDAAEELFADGGFDATPTARIAAAAGVPKGLVFYYFPRKIDLLLALLEERLPTPPEEPGADVVHEGDAATSLLRLHRQLGLDSHESLVLRSIVFRESGTHVEVRRYLLRLRAALVRATEATLDAALGSARSHDQSLRRRAADTFVAVMLDHANARRVGGAGPDLEGAAQVVALACSAG